MYFLFLLLSVLLLSARPAHAVIGWITTCNYVGHSLSDDPIVFPGLPGASHLHDFVGATTTNAFSNAATLQQGGTSCATQGDTSAYWIPATFQNGRHLLPTATATHALFYYRPGGPGPITPFPTGLKMVVGNAHATNVSENPAIGNDKIYWKCGPGAAPHLHQPPMTCPGGHFLVAVFQFPQCWDGVHLDSPDHFSHMAYRSGGPCPASHPVALPQITGYWRTPSTPQVGTITYASGPWFTLHADFFSAWRPAALASLTNECINGRIDCGINPLP